MTDESRREFLIAGIGLWQAASLRAQQERRKSGKNSQQESSLVFLNARRRDILRRLMDRIVPADERSTGAAGARVDEYIDFVLQHADANFQNAWREGLDRFGIAIDSKEGPAIDGFLVEQARNEFSPHTDDERFFVYLKTAVAEGFYTSQEGISKELGYKGMSFEMDFPGCTHAEHEVPADYRPLLRAMKKA
jgi:gluconate 2-dehydrogenase subunit 3-like protein